MAAMDPEDGLDQILSNTWSNLAQQLGMLHRSLDADVQQYARERQSAANQAERLRVEELREMERQRNRLLSWEAQNRRDMNAGFESVLNATVLSDAGCGALKDSSLLKAWNVSEQLVGTDPGYAVQLNQVRERLSSEWARRHDGEDIAQLAGRIGNRVTISYLDHTEQLQDTINAFKKAGMAVTLDHVADDDKQAFQNEHPGADFTVKPEMGEAWDGYDDARITECVLQHAVVDPSEIGDQIGFLRDAGLPESSHADNRAVGDEPSSLFEGSRDENENAAPASDEPARADDEREADDNATSEGTPTRAKVEGGGDLASGKTVGGKEKDELVDLNEPEEWDGPDLFGEYSPAQEASMTPASAPAAELPLPDVATRKETAGKDAR
ncbi:hypothetical protein BLEM_2063 [Bifidobacterium lemurum]|uniref:Uncharacterized protein n=2 Tax=Bifidobacterium lemurum TaxID=1603886 RepID=A0A261FLC0_9BIFI|nr:hypothetical protein BLEM_2063 [Bifidobacterium lemurum]QOL35481.1 hypothetical protein BL8807_09140 [Bifidobacterium lemurum]